MLYFNIKLHIIYYVLTIIKFYIFCKKTFNTINYVFFRIFLCF